MTGNTFLKISKHVMIMNLITVKITHQGIDKWKKRMKEIFQNITISAINN